MANYEPDSYMSQPQHNLLKETRTQFKIVGDTVYIETVTRKFMGTDDYQDSVSTEVLGRLNNE